MDGQGNPLPGNPPNPDEVNQPPANDAAVVAAAQTAGNIRINIREFDGTGGPTIAQAFVGEVDDAIQGGNIKDGQAAGVVRSLFKGKARDWLAVQRQTKAADIKTWTRLRVIFQARFCKRMTIAELKQAEAALFMKTDESVDDFYDRVYKFHLDEDAGVTAARKATADYIVELNARIKKIFIKGLRNEIRNAMIGRDVTAENLDTLVNVARNAEILQMKPSFAGVNTMDGQEDAAAVNAFRQFPRGGWNQRGGGPNRGRQGQYQRQQGQQRSNSNPQTSTYANRTKMKCTKCGKTGKHRAFECKGSSYVNPNMRPQTRSYANAVKVTEIQPQELFALGYEDSGNA